MKILVTGVAGFIGYHIAKRLIGKGHEIVGFDNINDYYDTQLKYDRLKELGISKDESDSAKLITKANFSFVKLSLEDREGVSNLFRNQAFDLVCHLAAQAGVRYSLQNPHAYAESNLVGFLNVLEGCRHNKVRHLVYASSSSVYGLNEKMPLSTFDSVDHPISLYAATKKSNELMAHAYSHLYGIPTTGLRFFTVYGPWGRPDMSPILFASAIKEGRPIKVFNYGEMMRDFTYIDDIVDGTLNVLFSPAEPQQDWDAQRPLTATSKAPYRIYNIGHSTPVELMHFISTIEKEMGKTAIKELLPIQPGDVLKTFADVSDLEEKFDYHPSTSVENGIFEFVKWFKNYYHA